VGKGKRIRKQRGNWTGRLRGRGDDPGAGPGNVDDFPFAVDGTTIEKLGEKGLAEVAANLWPVDCQSCGRPLGAGRPALYVGELVRHASATLHHRSCLQPEWSTTPSWTSEQFLSWTAQTFLLPGESGGQRTDRPLMVVNPSLEQVGLDADDDGNWHVSTVGFYRRLGLRPPGREFIVDRPVPDFTARLRGGRTVTVELEHPVPAAWSCSVNSEVVAQVRELEGITLGITTAINPHDLQRFDQLADLLRSGQLVLGWVPLDGVREKAPLREQPAPAALTTYVLHWGAEHATVGELLASTDRGLEPEQAQRWAEGWLAENRGVAAEQTIGWQPVRSDPAAHYTMDALSAGSYFVRRHQDGWKLVRVLSRIDGSAPRSDADARKWAEGAVRLRDQARVITWVPGPSTGPGFTTLHGSAAPRPDEQPGKGPG
jgi:hypothetical protein